MTHKVLVLFSGCLLFCAIQASSQDKTTAVFNTEAFDILSVTYSSERIDPKSVIDKLPNRLKPANASQSKAIVLLLKLVNKTEGMIEIKTSDFALSYKADNKETSIPCVGLSFGELWSFAEKGEDSVMVNAKPSAEQKILFLIPNSIKEVTLLYNAKDGNPVTIKQMVIKGSNT